MPGTVEALDLVVTGAYWDAAEWLLVRLTTQASFDGLLASPTVLAAKAGISYNALQDLLAGNASAQLETLHRIIDALNFSAGDKAFLKRAAAPAYKAAWRQRWREARGDSRRIRAARIDRPAAQGRAGHIYRPGVTPGPADRPVAPEPFAREFAAYVYVLGDDDYGDVAIERRVTLAGPGGLSCRVVGPGVVGENSYVDEPAVLGFEACVEDAREAHAAALPEIGLLANVRHNPLHWDAATRHTAYLRLVSFAPDNSRVAIHFDPPVPAGTWVQWFLSYRWPRVWQSARSQPDHMSAGFINFHDAAWGAIEVFAAARSPRSWGTGANTVGRLVPELTVQSEAAKALNGEDRGRGLHLLGWMASDPGSTALELRFADRKTIRRAA